MGHIRPKNSFRPFFCVFDLFQENVKELIEGFHCNFPEMKIIIIM